MAHPAGQGFCLPPWRGRRRLGPRHGLQDRKHLVHSRIPRAPGSGLASAAAVPREGRAAEPRQAVRAHTTCACPARAVGQDAGWWGRAPGGGHVQPVEQGTGRRAHPARGHRPSTAAWWSRRELQALAPARVAQHRAGDSRMVPQSAHTSPGRTGTPSPLPPEAVQETPSNLPQSEQCSKVASLEVVTSLLLSAQLTPSPMAAPGPGGSWLGVSGQSWGVASAAASGSGGL